MSTAEKERIEKILGRRICNEAFYTYCTREEYEREQGISMYKILVRRYYYGEERKSMKTITKTSTPFLMKGVMTA